MTAKYIAHTLSSFHVHSNQISLSCNHLLLNVINCFDIRCMFRKAFYCAFNKPNFEDFPLEVTPIVENADIQIEVTFITTVFFIRRRKAD